MEWVSNLNYQPAFLSPEQANSLLEFCARDLEWQQREIVLFGKPVLQPRLTAWCSEPGVGYSYSGLQLQAAPWHPELLALKRKVECEVGVSFNSVLANAYRDGRDSMGWHADDEPELGANPVIASVSLGVPRQFRIRPQPPASQPPPSGLRLAHGSLLVMRGDFQHRWQHCVTRTAKPVGLRINLTFRRIFGA